MNVLPRLLEDYGVIRNKDKYPFVHPSWLNLQYPELVPRIQYQLVDEVNDFIYRCLYIQVHDLEIHPNGTCQFLVASGDIVLYQWL